MIRDKRDLKLSYEIIRLTENLIRDNSTNDKELEKKRNDFLSERKREIRDFYKRHEHMSRRLIKDYGIDGYIELMELPNFLKSKKDAEEYFDEEEWIHCPLTAYDCTGRPFTGWVKIFKRRGKWMAYHRVEFDV